MSNNALPPASEDRRYGSLRMSRLLVLALLALGTGCGLLDTDQPNAIDPGNLDTPEGAEAARIGAIREFVFVKDGDGSQNDTEGMVVLTGNMSDEFAQSGFIPSTVEFDQRLTATNNGSLSAVYFRLHRARFATEDAANRLQLFATDPDGNSGIPEMLSLAGFTYVYFGEDFCSGVPYSSTEGGVVVPGPQDSTVGTLKRAVARFDSALGLPSGAVDPNIQYLAMVGKGRALLDLGLFPEAAAAVATVPSDFQYVTEHAASPLSLANAVFIYGVSGPSGGSISVADIEGGDGVPYRTAVDPRVPFFDTGHTGLDQTTPQFDVLKYPDFESPIVVADGIEARLIEAELDLQNAAYGPMNTKLNTLRAAFAPTLAALPVPATEAAAVDQLFSERAFWLYATGHRLSDMRRLVRQYGRPVDTVFPVGPYLRGGSYGTLVNFPVPIDEDPNPNFDRSKCDPTVP